MMSKNSPSPVISEPLDSAGLSRMTVLDPVTKDASDTVSVSVNDKAPHL